MSSVIEGVAAFLAGCPHLDNAQQINIDRYDPACGYSVSPTGQAVAKQYLDGSAVIESSFEFYFTDFANDDGERLENSIFLEQTANWIRQQAQRRNPPNLGEGRQARRLEASNGMLFATQDDGTAVYQLQLKLTYFQKGDR